MERGRERERRRRSERQREGDSEREEVSGTERDSESVRVCERARERQRIRERSRYQDLRAFFEKVVVFTVVVRVGKHHLGSVKVLNARREVREPQPLHLCLWATVLYTRVVEG